MKDRQTKGAAVITKARQVTYLGKRAEVWEDREGGQYGRRTIFTRWIDASGAGNGNYPAGTVTARTVEGDGRKPSFIVHVPTHVITI
jgi:hypothetical protein